MKLRCCSLLFLALVAVFADERTKAAKVEEFLRVSDARQVVDQGLAQIASQVKAGIAQQLAGVKLSPEQNRLVEEYQAKVIQLVSDSVSWEKMKPDYAKLYSEAYTEPELDAIIAFYKSPAGRTMVAKAPQLLTKSAELSQKRMLAAQPEVQRLMRDFMMQMQVTQLEQTPK